MKLLNWQTKKNIYKKAVQQLDTVMNAPVSDTTRL